MDLNKNALERRRDQAIASILSFKEVHCDSYLPHDISVSLRKKILDEINQLAELALELSDSEIIYNEFRERFDKMYDMVSEIYDD